MLRGIYSHGFEKPSLTQIQGTKPIMKKNDVILQAQSGSGKTATYAMGTLHNIDPASEKVQILALVPVRELGLQVHETYSAFS